MICPFLAFVVEVHVDAAPRPSRTFVDRHYVLETRGAPEPVVHPSTRPYTSPHKRRRLQSEEREVRRLRVHADQSLYAFLRASTVANVRGVRPALGVRETTTSSPSNKIKVCYLVTLNRYCPAEPSRVSVLRLTFFLPHFLLSGTLRPRLRPRRHSCRR